MFNYLKRKSISITDVISIAVPLGFLFFLTIGVLVGILFQ